MFIVHDRLPGEHVTANYYAIVDRRLVFASYACNRTGTDSAWETKRADYWIRRLGERTLQTSTYPNFKRSVHDCPIVYDLLAKIDEEERNGQKAK